MTARPGGVPPCATMRCTRSRHSSRILLATATPSMIFAVIDNPARNCNAATPSTSYAYSLIMRLAKASMKSAAALLPPANDFIASSCKRPSTFILMALAASLSVMSSRCRGEPQLSGRDRNRYHDLVRVQDNRNRNKVGTQAQRVAVHAEEDRLIVQSGRFCAALDLKECPLKALTPSPDGSCRLLASRTSGAL